jgi:hypothetical protein
VTLVADTGAVGQALRYVLAEAVDRDRLPDLTICDTRPRETPITFAVSLTDRP